MLGALRIITQIAWRNFIRNQKQNRVIILVLVISMVLSNFLISMPNGIGNQMRDTAINNILDNASIRTPRYSVDQSIWNTFHFEEEKLASIRKDTRVEGATLRTIMPIVIQSERKARNALLVGIDTATEGKTSFFPQEYKGNLALLDEGNIIIGEKLRQKLQTQKGYRLVLHGQDIHQKAQEIGIQVADTFTSGTPGAEDFYVFASIKTVQNFGKAEGLYSTASVKLKNIEDTDAFVDILENIAPPGTEVLAWYTAQPFVAMYLDFAIKMMYIFLSFVFIASVIPLSNSLMISILDRINEFGIVQALGGKPFFVILQVMIEGLCILGCGAILGILASVVLVGILQEVGINISFISAVRQFLGTTDHLYPKMSLKLFFYNAIFLSSIGFIAICIPAIRASRYNPALAIGKKK